MDARYSLQSPIANARESFDSEAELRHAKLVVVLFYLLLLPGVMILVLASFSG